MANVRKLMRMAREYEADEGRDLRGFIDFVAERDLVQAAEGQAPLEAEDLDAVRLMTVHRAKGLEFPLVCVADLGKTGREDDAALRVTEDGRMGMRLASLSGESVDSAEMARIKEQQKAEDEEEERRIFYVAATRAQEHLLLSGATDLVKLRGGGGPPGADALDLARAGAGAGGDGGGGGGHRQLRRPRGAGGLPDPASRRGGRAAGRGRPPPGGARARAARPRGAGRARPGGGGRTPRAAGQPAELLGAGGLPALRLPLLPRAGAEAAPSPRRRIP
ncbi:MAG: 3'-5' exonuclease [Thermoleophilaceae bacterium]